jgi:HAD superfamily hydrolase (TIGR01490 family)
MPAPCKRVLPEGTLTAPRICFFDMDKTLIDGNSGVSFMRYARRHNRTNRWRELKAIWDYVRYRFDLLDMGRAYRASLEPLIGVRAEDLAGFCEEWFSEEIQPLIYAEARSYIRQHVSRGEVVTIISNATTYAVAPLARHLGIPHVLATQLEIRDGAFTGNYIEPLCFRYGKIFWAEKLAAELRASLEESTFYTDSITDLPLLERVRNPRVVNPDPKLRVLARKRGWPVEYFKRSGGGRESREKVDL